MLLLLLLPIIHKYLYSRVNYNNMAAVIKKYTHVQYDF